MRKPRLDRSRDYGEVHPAGAGGVHYRQDGLPFDHEGHLVEAALSSQQIEELKKPEQPRPAKGGAAPASKFSLEQLKALDALNLLDDEQKAALERMSRPDGKKAGSSSQDGEGEGGDGTVNLELWLKGEVNYRFGRVTDAVFERFKVKFTKMEDVVDFLVLRPDGPHLVAQAEVAEKYQKALGAAA